MVRVAGCAVSWILLAGGAGAQDAATADPDEIAAAREDALVDTQIELEELLDESGGLEAAYEDLAPLREAFEDVIRGLQPGTRTVAVGSCRHQPGILAFVTERFRSSDLGDGDPIRVIIDFHDKLQQRGIDLIVIPVPAKVELYADEFEDSLPAGGCVSPGRVEAMLALLEAEVEVIDVLPTLQAARPHAEVPLYELNGHHLSGLGVKLAGELVAERLSRYEFASADPARFTERRGTGTERVDRSVPMKVWQVRDQKTGKPYQHVEESPVVVIGDSHAFAYSTASWASHIARALGLPISDLSESSGGAQAHDKLARQGAERLDQRRVVVWIFTSVMALVDDEPWKVAPLYEQPAVQEHPLVEQARVDLATYREDPARLLRSEQDLLQLGQQLIGIDQAALAVEVFQVVTKRFPDHADGYYGLGVAIAETGDQERAIAVLVKLLALDPGEKTRVRAEELLARLRGQQLDS